MIQDIQSFNFPNNGTTIGALAVSAVVEPPALDAAAIREQAAVIRMALDEIEQLLGDGEPGDA